MIDFPTDVIKRKDIRERLSHMPFHNSLTEIENLCSNDNESSTIQMRIPVAVYGVLKPFLNGEIQNSYQYVSKAAVQQIVVTVKSLLIDYLLKISKDENIDFNSFVKTKATMITHNNITAGIVNMGDGTIHAEGATTVIGDNNTINNEQKKSLQAIIESIDRLAEGLSNRHDYDEVSTDIKEELKKDNPRKGFLKRCFQAIPTILGSLSSDIIANQLQPYVSSALSLLV